jgi:hypothetical protein
MLHCPGSYSVADGHEKSIAAAYIQNIESEVPLFSVMRARATHFLVFYPPSTQNAQNLVSEPLYLRI